MKHNDEFVPETVEEQIDQFTYSFRAEPLSPNAQVIQELHAYYKEDQHSVEHMWERLAPYVAEHKSTILPVSDQPETVTEVFAEKIPSRRTKQRSPRRKGTPQITLIAAIFCASLVVGSLLFVFQMVQYTHTGSSPSASSHSLYISRGGDVSRIDLQTHKTIWHTTVPKFDARDEGNLVVFYDTLYLSLTSYIYALNIRDGHILWSNKISSYGFSPKFHGNILYVQTTLNYEPALYALNPANGKIEATYVQPDEFPGGSTLANGILYSATPTDLYATTLNQRIVWHQHYYFGSSPRVVPIEVRAVENGIVYVQATVHTSIKTYQITMAFDATTGKKLWQLNNIEILAFTESTVYTTQDPNNLTSSAPLNALDAHTHKLLWHQSINPSKIQSASDWYIVENVLVNSGTLYVSYENNSSIGGIVALKASDGTQLWRANISGELRDSPLGIQNGVLYTNTFNNNKNSAIDALKASDGSRLWHMPLPAGDLWRAIIA